MSGLLYLDSNLNNIGIDIASNDVLQYGNGIPTPIQRYYTLTKLRDQYSVKFSINFTNYECKVRSLAHISLRDLPVAIGMILSAILDEALNNVPPTDKVRIRLDSRHLDRPIWTPPIQRDQLTVDRIMLEVSRVLQSHEDFRLDDTFSLWVQHAAIPGGTCSTIDSKQNALLLRKLREKRCVTVIKNDDDICLARALVVVKALADKDEKLYATLRRQKKPTHHTDRTEQTRRALYMIKKAGLTVRRFTLADIQYFERVLSEYMIVIVGVEQLNSVIYAGAYKEKKILLLLHSEHFDVLTSLPAWFEHNMYCFHCLQCYDRRESHRCLHTCKQCLKQDCPSLSSKQPSIHCENCNRNFKGNECFAAHKTVHSPRYETAE